MNKKFKIIGIIIISLIIILIVAFIMGKHLYLGYQKQEEAKTKAKVHRELKKRGWEDKIKTEKPSFVLNTGENDVEVTFKDEPYNTYTYSFDDDNKLTGEAILKEKYDKYFDSKKKHKDYIRRPHFEEKYDIK
ncbi:DUF3139 domain-containing protein [Staphylococcus sp. SQ8-PEA]|uniref:DUF3139 domain-containing protein n=1 Tax=Staphylococcus marylandisciuri TaxID=2981529 RepID=A0ABT2QS68_9STAP|nr:DUF3139 domain-containing protein [Staphylococcus marylandisciuri]MCU5746824.1 DUF3139 domain-containing protein [Staphylococcus marylandisciuri]